MVVNVVCEVCGRSFDEWEAIRKLDGSVVLDEPKPGKGFIRADRPENADRRHDIRGPRSGRRRFTVVEGRDGYRVARFDCGCGRKPRLMDTNAIARALKHTDNGKVYI
jgi:hypothetical protein